MTAPFELSRERRIDWARIIANLQTAGMSQRQICEALAISQGTLAGYLNDEAPSEPAYWLGHCMVLLWCDRCGTQLQDVPIRKVQLTVSAMLRSMS